MPLVVEEPKSEILPIRFTPSDLRALAAEAGGRRKVPAYLRGVLRGAGIIGKPREREESDDGR